MSDNTSRSGGIGVLGLLGVVFITLKLMHYIDWSWWYVTLPLWGVLAFALLFCAIVFLAFMFVELFK